MSPKLLGWGGGGVGGDGGSVLRPLCPGPLEEGLLSLNPLL